MASKEAVAEPAVDVSEIYMLATLMTPELSLHPNKFYKVGHDGLTQKLANELVAQRKDPEDGHSIGPFAEVADAARARIAAEKEALRKLQEKTR